MLKFFGVGSAFNTVKGNTSAYYKWDGQILIIDCGSSIFSRIVESGILDGVNHIHVAITHTHADHVGSLADLVLYSYFSHGNLAEKNLSIYAPVLLKVDQLLDLNGCIKDVHYNFVESITPFYYVVNDSIDLIFERSTHVNEIPSYSIFLHLHGYELFYSGDTSTLTKKTLKMIHNGVVDYAYIDTSGLDYEGNVHLSFRELCELINPEARHRVYCMHLDKAFDYKKAIEEGFNVAKEIQL